MGLEWRGRRGGHGLWTALSSARKGRPGCFKGVVGSRFHGGNQLKRVETLLYTASGSLGAFCQAKAGPGDVYDVAWSGDRVVVKPLFPCFPYNLRRSPHV